MSISFQKPTPGAELATRPTEWFGRGIRREESARVQSPPLYLIVIVESDGTERLGCEYELFYAESAESIVLGLNDEPTGGARAVARRVSTVFVGIHELQIDDGPAPKPDVPTSVLVVSTPDDWTPTSVDDNPTTYVISETYVKSSSLLAKTFARHFNELEISDRTGSWAIVAPSPTTVHIVETPDDWTPGSPDDVPPLHTFHGEEHVEPSAGEARAFVEGFNEAELKNPRGYWAIVLEPAAVTV